MHLKLLCLKTNTTWMLILGLKSCGVLTTCSLWIIRQLPEGKSLAASQHTVSRNATSKRIRRCPPSAPHLLTGPCIYVVGLVKPKLNLSPLLISPNFQPCAGCSCLEISN